MSPEKKPRFDTTIRLDFLLALTIFVGSMLIANVKMHEQTAMNTRDIQRTSAVLDRIERRVRDNEDWIHRHEGASSAGSERRRPE